MKYSGKMTEVMTDAEEAHQEGEECLMVIGKRASLDLRFHIPLVES